MNIWDEVTIWDKLLIGIIIAGSIAGTILIATKSVNTNKKNIVIKVDNKIVKEISVDENTKPKTYDFRFGENTGYIEVKDGAVRMLEMDKSICPEGICSDTGWISKSYEAIVCLPNRIIVNIEGNQENNVDTTT